MAVGGGLFCSRELIDSKSTTSREMVTLLETFIPAVFLTVLVGTALVVFCTNAIRDARVVEMNLQ